MMVHWIGLLHDKIIGCIIGCCLWDPGGFILGLDEFVLARLDCRTPTED